MFEGNATYYFSDGNKYVGMFSTGMKDGSGIMFYRSGERREGTWVKDKLVGKVMFHLGDGTVKEEVWEEEADEQEIRVKMGNMDNFHSLTTKLKDEGNAETFKDIIPLSFSKQIQEIRNK